MAWNEGFDSRAYKAQNDFTGMQYKAVDLDTTEINAAKYAAGGTGLGILMNEPRSLEFATVAVEGVIRARAAAAVAIGDYITVAVSATGGSGWLRKVISADAGPAVIMGKALSSAASGSLFTLDLDPKLVNAVNLVV